MKKATTCILCNHKELTTMGTHTYHYPGADVKNNLLSKKYVRLWILFTHVLQQTTGSVQFTVEKCHNCGFIFSNPRFSRAEMATKYRLIDELGSVKLRIQHQNNKYVAQRSERIFKLVNGISKKHNVGTERTNIVDFGGQTGTNLKGFDQNGYDCQVLDFEQWDLPGTIKYAGKELPDLKEKTQILLCNHTLEHIVDPIPFMQEMVHHLEEDGLIYIEVPLGAFYREYKKMMAIEPMTHVNYFSEQSMSYLFEQVGLQMLHLSTDYQHLQTAKQWCINAIGMKTTKRVSTSIKQPLSADAQIGKELYYNGVFVLDHAVKRVGSVVGI